MKKRFGRKNSSLEPQMEPDAADPITAMQQQLVVLEKKIDILISQSQDRPRPFKRDHFSKPFQRFGGHSFGQDRQRQGNDFREREFHKVICAECKKECEVPFKPSGDRPIYCKECFAKRRGGGSSFRPDFDSHPREGGFTQGRHFDKRQGGEGRRQGKRGKPSFRRRKERA